MVGFIYRSHSACILKRGMKNRPCTSNKNKTKKNEMQFFTTNYSHYSGKKRTKKKKTEWKACTFKKGLSQLLMACQRTDLNHWLLQWRDSVPIHRARWLTETVWKWMWIVPYAVTFTVTSSQTNSMWKFGLMCVTELSIPVIIMKAPNKHLWDPWFPSIQLWETWNNIKVPGHHKGT